MILDSKQTYFDVEGNRLAGGRLRFYLHATTTPATVYADQEHNTPVGGSVALTSAGWTPFELFSDEDLDVRADKFLGLDEFGLEIYMEVKSFRYIPGGTGSAGGDTASMAVVESIADLRELSTSFSAALVLGYHAKGDCPARTFINVSVSAATDNSGTIVGSTADPTMRWVWTPDCAEIDCRTFGVIPSASTTVNSQLSAYLNYCDTNKAVAYFPAGAYQLAPGSLTSNACIHARNGVQLRRGQLPDSNTANWYHLTLTNPNCRFEGTFAGTCFKVILEGPGWEETLHPLSLWDPTAKGYAEGTATFGLLLTDTSPVSLDTDRSYSRLVLRAPAIPVTIKADSTVYIDHTEGTGSITWLGAVPFLREARRSHCNNLASSVAARCSELFIVDKPLTLASSTAVSCLVQVLPPATLSLNAGCTLSRGVLGYPGCLTGANGFASDAEVDINLYTNPNAAMDSWNRSTASNALDLKSRTVTVAPAKSGRIVNGVIQADSTDTSVELILDNVSFVGYYAGITLKANSCTLSHPTTKPLGAGTHSHLTDCAISSVYYLIVDPDTTTNWTRVAISGRVVKKGNGGVWRDVRMSGGCYFVPDADGHCGNFSWVGGAATSIHLDCSQRSTEGACVLFNFEIRGLIGLAYGIKAFDHNTSSRYWASEGHYNVRIGDNEGGAATYGTAVGTQISGGSSLITIPCDTTQILFLTKNHSYEQVRAAGRVWSITSIAPAYGPPSWSGEGGFVCYPPAIPSISGSRTRGDVGDDTRCTFNFEIYRKKFI